jgi:choline dehydrogenase-like flavoprotein
MPQAATITESRHYDLIIVGSGAGGGTLAYALANTGKQILILERGQELPVEPQNWDSKAVFIDHRYRTSEQWLDKTNKPFTPNTNYWVGGNTTFYGAALMRMKKRDFEAVEHRRPVAGLAALLCRFRAVVRKSRDPVARAWRARHRPERPAR